MKIKTLIKIGCCAVLLCTPAILLSQNAYTLLRSVNVVMRPTICREIFTKESLAALAKETAFAQNPTHIGIQNLRYNNGKLCIPGVKINTSILVSPLKDPKTIYGGYNYLRTISRLSTMKGAVTKDFAKEWKHIHNSTGYNGAHHIVNKQTLKAIVELEKERAAKTGRTFSVNIKDLENDAPAIFHPKHGDPGFKYVFHNATEQFTTYQQYGMRFLIVQQLAKMDYINQTYGYPTYSNRFMWGLLLEAELWCKHYGLVWQYQ